MLLGVLLVAGGIVILVIARPWERDDDPGEHDGADETPTALLPVIRGPVSGAGRPKPSPSRSGAGRPVPLASPALAQSRSKLASTEPIRIGTDMWPETPPRPKAISRPSPGARRPESSTMEQMPQEHPWASHAAVQERMRSDPAAGTGLPGIMAGVLPAVPAGRRHRVEVINRTRRVPSEPGREEIELPDWLGPISGPR
jgi:hypothetical protein